MLSIIKFSIYDKGINEAVKFTFSIQKKYPGYICLVPTHGFSLSLINTKFKEILMNALLILPDGKPVALYDSIKKNCSSKQVRGIDFMYNIIKTANDSKSKNNFFFLGGNTNTKIKISRILKKNFPNINILGFDTRKIDNDYENNELIEVINLNKPDFVFVGLGCPKQEIWMFNNYKKINSILIGVGAAFDFFSGNKKQAPKIFQKYYLEWLYRFIQEPRRLFIRYIIYNTIFVIHFFLVLPLLILFSIKIKFSKK